jgi:hypothetical protein
MIKNLYWSDGFGLCFCEDHIPNDKKDSLITVDPFEDTYNSPLFCTTCEQTDGTYSEENMFEITSKVAKLREAKKLQEQKLFRQRRKKLVINSTLKIKVCLFS